MVYKRDDAEDGDDDWVIRRFKYARVFDVAGRRRRPADGATASLAGLHPSRAPGPTSSSPLMVHSDTSPRSSEN